MPSTKSRDYMTGEELGQKLLASIKQMNAGQVGRITHVPTTEAARARANLGLSQREFAGLLGVSLRTLQEWEQARRTPSRAARTLIRVAIAAPEVLRPIAADMAAETHSA